MTSYYVTPHVTTVMCLFIVHKIEIEIEIEIENQIKENEENEKKMKKY